MGRGGGRIVSESGAGRRRELEAGVCRDWRVGGGGVIESVVSGKGQEGVGGGSHKLF